MALPDNFLLAAVFLHFAGTALIVLTLAKGAAIMRQFTARIKDHFYFRKSKHSSLTGLLIIGSLGYLTSSAFFTVNALAYGSMPPSYVPRLFASFIAMLGSFLVLYAIILFSRKYPESKPGRKQS